MGTPRKERRNRRQSRVVTPDLRPAALVLLIGATVEAALIRLGQTYGSTPEERAMRLPGDDVVPEAQVVTNHAITVDAPPD